jgi:hypothetical protein
LMVGTATSRRSEALWARYYTAAPRLRTRSELDQHAMLGMYMGPFRVNRPLTRAGSRLIDIPTICDTWDSGVAPREWLMLLREDLLKVAKRNVERSRELVYRQRAVVRNLQEAGLETTINEGVLGMFERSLAKCESELDRLSPKKPVAVPAHTEPKAESER